VPTRKQRRRRAKERRHEYEYVYVDESGEEVELDPAELEEEEEEEGRRPSTKPKAKQQKQQSAPFRGGREVQPPSWRRVGKRAVIFAPFMFLTLLLLDQDRSYDLIAINTVVLLAFFLPFSYVLDTLMYRVYVRRAGGQAKPRAGVSRRR
jgi:hypothetical protein